MILIRRLFPRHSDLELLSKPASFRLGTTRGSLEALAFIMAKWQARSMYFESCYIPALQELQLQVQRLFGAGLLERRAKPRIF